MKTRDEIVRRIAELKSEMALQADLVSRYNATQAAIKVVNNGG